MINKTHNHVTMKKIKFLVPLVLAAIFFSSCNPLNKMSKDYGDVSYKVTPEILEAHGGQVAVSITGNFPEKYFNKKAMVEATPVLVYEGGETPLKSIVLQGEDLLENNKKISYAGGKFSYSDVTPYKEEMKKSELMLRATATYKTKSLPFDDVKLADGVIATSTYVCKKPEPMIMSDHFKRIIPKSKMADIMYQINRANIRSSQLKSEDIKTLKNFLKEAEAAKNMELVNTEISSYASPDGPLDFNDKLSQKRSSSSSRFFNRELKRAKVEEAQKEGFVMTKTTAEDWDGFKALMEKSDIQDKDLILRVLSMYSDPAVREKEIKNISAAYKVIADKILPQLRRSKITINVNKIGFSDEEISNYVFSKPDTLGLEEVLYAATLTDDLNQKLKIYSLAQEKAPKCVRAANNTGYVQMLLGNTEDAKASFEKAQTLNDNDVVKSNLGYASLVLGDTQKAKEYFTSVEKPAQETKDGLGIISIIEGKYQDAVNYFGTTPSYNGALAKILNGDAQGAKTDLDNLKEESAKISYLKAIAGVRLQNEDYMFNNLRTACDQDAKLKDTAKKDLEFGKYFENDTFKSIVQ